ncbi:MAG: C_GCAxxG_C_C family protein [Proteobacteria bacterium]|nr:C_GCAxxG_C_C family protein [Pseudomonadota bacterium]
MAKAKRGVSSIGAVGAFLSGRACSDTLFHVINRAYDQPLKAEELATQPFAGGIMQHGYQCGMIWGATLAAGAEAYRRFGPGAQAETRAIIAAQKVIESFHARNNTINCLEITDLNTSSTTMQMVTYFLIKGGAIGCFRMAGGYAPVAFREIDAVLAEQHIEAPVPPVSCAAMLAQKVGLSDMHTVMAAGLAGGIGLSGGACGALGAALWIIALNCIEESGGKLAFKEPRAQEAIEVFIKCTEYEFECCEIVGRKFENVDDHSGYLRGGGCAKIIDTLASLSLPESNVKNVANDA